MNNQGQLESWINQFKKQATTWTNHVTGPMGGFDEVWSVLRSAFIRQAFLTGEPIHEFSCLFPGGLYKIIAPAKYKTIYSGTYFSILISENCAVGISASDTFFVIGSSEDVATWKHISENNE